jgi:hypothetical protein
MSTATRLLWSAAGKPHVRAQRPRRGADELQCWWCGELSTDAEDVAPVEVAVADSFSDAYLAQAPLSKAVCLPCAWTMQTGMDLPPSLAAERLGNRLGLSWRGNRRVYVTFEGARHAYEMAVQDEQRIEAERAAAPPAPTSPTPS